MCSQLIFGLDQDVAVLGDLFAGPRQFVVVGGTHTNDWPNNRLPARSAGDRNKQFGSFWFGNKMVAPLPAPSK